MGVEYFISLTGFELQIIWSSDYWADLLGHSDLKAPNAENARFQKG